MSLLASLPAEDRGRSPLTGWVRGHWEVAAEHWLGGVARHASPEHARVSFPGTHTTDAVDQLEGFARGFLLGALRIADVGGGPWVGWFAQALTAGSDPENPEAWPVIGHHDQTLVEAAAIALGLHWSRPWLWDELDALTRERLVAWLSGARGRWCADNNHVLLGASVEAFLASVEADHDPLAISAALGRIEDFYVGDGWYSDGPGRRFDHYNAYTFHFYPLLIAELLGSTPSSLAPEFEVYRRRLRLFLEDYQHLFDADGAPVLQGRSLTYRWGMLAPVWLGVRFDASPLTPGQTRRLASGVLRHFVQGGVGEDDVQSLGWHGPSRSILQPYNAPGSPLWSSKGFLGLLLPAEHPVWTATEQPLEDEDRDVLRPLPGPNWLVHATHEDRVVRLLNHGSDGHPRKADPWYRRLAYSTKTAPTELDGVGDNLIDVVSGPLANTEGSIHRGLLGGRTWSTGASSRQLIDADGREVLIDVATTTLGPAELRLARVRGAVAMGIRVSGYAVSSKKEVFREESTGWARVSTEWGLSSLLAVVPGIRASELLPPQTKLGEVDTPFGQQAGLPYAILPPSEDNEVRLAWLVALTGQPWDPAEALASLRIEWLSDGATVVADDESRHVPWVGEERWSADRHAQGVFRAGG